MLWILARLFEAVGADDQAIILTVVAWPTGLYSKSLINGSPSYLTVPPPTVGPLQGALKLAQNSLVNIARPLYHHSPVGRRPGGW